MTNTPSDPNTLLGLPREVHFLRLKQVIDQELTPRQRYVLTAYYFEGLRPAHIARQLGIHRSTVHRTLQRAEARLRRYLAY